MAIRLFLIFSNGEIQISHVEFIRAPLQSLLANSIVLCMS